MKRLFSWDTAKQFLYWWTLFCTIFTVVSVVIFWIDVFHAEMTQHAFQNYKMLAAALYPFLAIMAIVAWVKMWYEKNLYCAHAILDDGTGETTTVIFVIRAQSTMSAKDIASKEVTHFMNATKYTTAKMSLHETNQYGKTSVIAPIYRSYE